MSKDIFDRIADATSHLRSSSWDYDHPSNAWESMPWFVRWPLAVIVGLFFLGAFLAPLALVFR